MIRLVVVALVLSSTAYAQKELPRVPATIAEGCVPLGTKKAEMRLEGMSLQALAELVGTLQCVQFELPQELVKTKPIDVPKQIVTGDQVLAWFLDQLSTLGYQVKQISERVYRCQPKESP